MDEAGTSASAGSAPRGGRPARSGVFYKFTQQDLPAWKPTMTPGYVIAIFLIIGIIFVPVGLICLQASNRVAEIVHRYDIDCVPNAYRSNKQAYIKDSSISKKCIQKVKVQYHMKAPIFVYYELDNFYQNHRRYIKSRSDKQLRHGLQYTDSSCSPMERSNGLPVVPCGLIAWSLFNDTYDFTRGSMGLMVDRKNISWRSDREHKYGQDVYPFNFQNGSLIGGGKLDPDIPLSNQEDLIVWMRAAALPQFRKLYGVIEEDIQADETITMHITNNYNTYSFGGKKSLVLTTSTWLGGKNDFLGYAYLITGSSSIFLSILFALIHVKIPRPHGDAAYLSWSRKNGNN
ncbi:putative ALA-interacting subunit 2 [Triticum urartu]|uniref:ALA-interacting subunit n=1 Tax=Triticum urartu TaxID=4572 RepID=A0A8R7QGD9_TRIUA|nr:putative ALA-interacting subunit 2 [Triticum urartu]XP_048532077.1 putative ALA-interacting subunit 2 [Triticum urartu]